MNRPHFRTPYSEGCFCRNAEESVGLEFLLAIYLHPGNIVVHVGIIVHDLKQLSMSTYITTKKNFSLPICQSKCCCLSLNLISKIVKSTYHAVESTSHLVESTSHVLRHFHTGRCSYMEQ